MELLNQRAYILFRLLLCKCPLSYISTPNISYKLESSGLEGENLLSQREIEEGLY